MPTIFIEFDDQVVDDQAASDLSEATVKIVSRATNIEDVFVYANSARIKVQIAPIEIFIQMSDHKITDRKSLADDIAKNLSQWKSDQKFPHKINMTLIPMDWDLRLNL